MGSATSSALKRQSLWAWEAERYGQLYLKFERGEIEELDRQIRFNILVNDQKICAYVADYTYYETDESGERQYIVEDAKGVETPEFKLKKKLMLAANGIDIRISKK